MQISKYQILTQYTFSNLKKAASGTIYEPTILPPSGKLTLLSKYVVKRNLQFALLFKEVQVNDEKQGNPSPQKMFRNVMIKF